MLKNLSVSIDKTLYITFLALTVITPILFSTKNSELFEVPKMFFVYFCATLILFLTLFKFIQEKKITIPENLIVLSLLIFLILQIISTLTSIDKFTSIFGFPSRLNGGLLSQVAYLTIFGGALVNLTSQRAKQLIVAAIVTTTAVSLWGIPGHFGYDPNCLILTGHLNATCWQADFDPTKRIFSTLGQPNWLASYLVLTLPITIAMSIIGKNLKKWLIFSALSSILFAALIFTSSRAGLVGISISFVIFGSLLGKKYLSRNLKIIAGLTLAFLLVITIFSKPLILRINEALGLANIKSPGTESTKIRLIVWQGAWQVFIKQPLLGTGPETFAYSYYLVRPLAHNLTTEWNFFYNKAHNEFLNYLANIGILGTSAYLLFLFTSFLTLLRITKGTNRQISLVAKGLIGSLAGYQLTIFFGFSTVPTQTLAFLLMACVLILANKSNLKIINLHTSQKSKTVISAIIIIFGSWFLTATIRLYLADIYFAHATDLGVDDPQSQKYFNNALKFSPVANPFYFAQYAYAQSFAVSADETVNQDQIKKTADFAQKAITLAPNNIMIIRRVANSYFLLAAVDAKYEQRALELGRKMIELAPTDPQFYLAYAKIQTGLSYDQEAIETLKSALNLKSDYLEAKELLDQISSEAIQ